MAQKKGIFIGKVNSLLQEFGNISPNIILKLLNSSAMTFYGSNLWELFGKSADKLYNSYNVAIRNTLKIDRCTHRFLIEPLSSSHHLKTLLASKFVAFHESLITSTKMPVRFLARLVENDLRTVHGRNLREIADQCYVGPNISLLRPQLVKKHVKYKLPSNDEKWKVNMCKELLKVRDDEMNIPGFSSEEQAELLKYLCTSS